MTYDKTKKTKTTLNGTQPGIRPRHITAQKNLGKYRTEAEALEALNYSKSYAKSGQIKSTESWKKVSERMLPNNLLAEVNLGLLKHKAWQARSSGLDKAYKAKKIYTNGVEITNNYDGKTKEELIESILRRISGNKQGAGSNRKER